MTVKLVKVIVPLISDSLETSFERTKYFLAVIKLETPVVVPYLGSIQENMTPTLFFTD